MKKILIPTLFALLVACSGGQKKVGSVYYAFTPQTTNYGELARALFKPCPGQTFCQTVLLRKGAKIPDYPLRSIDDLVGIYAYDKDRFEPLDTAWNCAYLAPENTKSWESDCLTVERANELLAPYVKK